MTSPRAHSRRFRFGAGTNAAADAKTWRALARKAEGLGCSTLVIPDHYTDQLGPFTALAVAAAATTSLRVGMLVACNDFRHPLAHAKELATLDLLSNGRAEWGIGAGWLEPEYANAGIPFDPAAVRVDRTKEAVGLMRQIFAGEPVEFDGAHYQVSGLRGRPRPKQRPHPPLLVGASARRMLGFAAREADVIGIGPSLTTRSLFGQPPQHTPDEATDLQLSWIREAAPTRFDAVELNMVAFPTVVTGDRSAAAAGMAASLGVGPDSLLGSPHAWLGTVEEICASLEERRARWGISYWVVPAEQLDEVAPIIDRLAGR